MKWCLFLTSVILATQSSRAAPCGTSSLSGYVGLGATGCTIGTNTLFDFQVLTGTSGATSIMPSAITIAPTGGTFNPGISASINSTASAGTVLEAFFTYRISGNIYTNDMVTLSGSTESAGGAVTDIQNFCAGGTFGASGVTGCTGTSGNLLVLDGVQNLISTGLPTVTLLSVTDDFTLDGGVSGSTQGGTISDQFTALPEPSTLFFAATGFALAIGLKRLRISVLDRGKE